MEKQEMMALRWQTFGLVGIVLMAAACESTERRMEEASGVRETEETAMTEPAAEVTPTPAERGMPATIEKAEKLSDEIHSDIDHTDWDDAARKARELQAISDSLTRTDAPKADVVRYDSAVNTLAANITREDKVAAGLAASEVHRRALALAAAYSPEVPVAIGYMDAASRDVYYHGEATEWEKAEADLENLENQYSKLRAHVAQRDRDLSEKVEREIEELRGAIAGRDLDRVKKASGKVRDHLDDIARTYK